MISAPKFKFVIVLLTFVILLIPIDNRSFASVPLPITENISVSLRSAFNSTWKDPYYFSGEINSVKFTMSSTSFPSYGISMKLYNAGGTLIGQTAYISSGSTEEINFAPQTGVYAYLEYGASCKGCGGSTQGTFTVGKVGHIIDVNDLIPVQNAAQNAQNAAQNANNTMNNIISPKLTNVEGAIRDGSGNTVATIASWANSNADAAKWAAWEARDRAVDANNNAWNASQNALFVK